jgi:glycosyltransferase involved in cell wall biosynthesis
VPDASNYLKAFDLFLLPSIKEGMPYVLLEAAAAELPIIATEAADTAYSMQIPTKNASVIAEAILKIQGRKVSASTLFRLETMMERTIELY